MCATCAFDTGETVGQYVDSAAYKAQKGVIWRHVGLLIEGTECARSEFLDGDGGAPPCHRLFHVKHSDKRCVDPRHSGCSGCVAQLERHVPCIPVPMRKRSNRADAKMNADLQRWLIESGEAEELVAFLREERAPHPVRPPRVAVTTNLDVDMFDAMMARAASEGITSRSGALRAAVREWVSDVKCLPEARQN